MGVSAFPPAFFIFCFAFSLKVSAFTRSGFVILPVPSTLVYPCFWRSITSMFSCFSVDSFSAFWSISPTLIVVCVVTSVLCLVNPCFPK